MDNHTRPAPGYRRFGAAVMAAGALVIGLIIGSVVGGGMAPAAATAAADDPDDDPVAQASAWLATSLDAGLMHFPDTGDGEYDDYGMSLDVYLGLKAADAEPEKQKQIMDAVAAHIDEYVSSSADQDGAAVYAGSTAKAIVAAQAADRDPHDFGDVDLVDRLESAVGSDGAISDTSDFGDNANVFGQAFAVQALAQEDSDSAGDVRDYLLDQQCDSGAFTQDFDADCDDPNVDTTAATIAALAQAGEAGMDGLADAVDNAADWLAGEQTDDGAFADPDAGTNANSTGVAAQALSLVGDDDAAESAATWLESLQVTDDADGQLADDVGAVAFNKGAFEAAESQGIQEDELVQWRGATAQALIGLAAADINESGHANDDPAGMPLIAWAGIAVLVVVIAGGVALTLRRRTRS